MSKPVGCQDIKGRLVTEGVIVLLAVMFWTLGVFPSLPGVGEAAAQDSKEVYQRVYNGWKWWHVYCARCHGENAVGSHLAPNLTDPNRKLAHEQFLQVVREGTPEKGMPAWNQLLEDKQVTDIYMYVTARSDRVLAPGRPDEVGANGGPWVPPKGWPEANSVAAVPAVPAGTQREPTAAPSTVAPEAESPPSGSDTAHTADPLMDAFRSHYQSVRLNLIETAEVMPGEHYDFRLTPAQRPFGEWIAHTTMLNYNSCSRMQGVPRPETEHLHHLTEKEALKKALRDSFEFCDTALKQMNDARALTELKVAERSTYSVQAMLELLSALNSHYGNLVGYLRTKGIVPPSTARREGRKRSSP